jgi:hypothetical protein
MQPFVSITLASCLGILRQFVVAWDSYAMFLHGSMVRYHIEHSRRAFSLGTNTTPPSRRLFRVSTDAPTTPRAERLQPTARSARSSATIPEPDQNITIAIRLGGQFDLCQPCSVLLSSLCVFRALHSQFHIPTQTAASPPRPLTGQRSLLWGVMPQRF